MESIYLTGNNDTNFQILYHLDDQDLEELCYTNHEMHRQCQNPYLWRLKIETIYPDFPVPCLQYIEMKKLYYKLKQQDWTSIMVWADKNNYKCVIEWIINEREYNMYMIKHITDYTKVIHKNDDYIIPFFNFVYNHRDWFNSVDSDYSKIQLIINVKQLVKSILNLYIRQPEYNEIATMYLKNIYI